jgi:DNA-binding transcriptional LysR family regulator
VQRPSPHWPVRRSKTPGLSLLVTHRVLDIPVRGRISTDDPSTAIAACVSGYGVFQSLELGLGPWLRSGKLVQILSEWGDERWPLYAYYASRHLPPAKIRAFLDFVRELVVPETND